MKLKIRIAMQTMPGCQHETSFEHALCGNGWLLQAYCRTFQQAVPVPGELWYTIRMAEKIAVITGASSGFGLLTTVELARAGFRVIATMRDLGRRERLDAAIAAGGVAGNIDVRALDVTRFDTIPSFVESVVRDYLRIDVLVNNAGFAVAGFVEDVKLEELRMQFETNFFGAVAMTKAVLPVMRKQGSGHIIQISSIGGLQGSLSLSSYSASKHALEGWSESLRLEVKPLGIRVVLVEPGAFATDIWTRDAVMAKEAVKDTSPNYQRSLRMRSAVEKLPKADPIAVAKMIVEIVQDPNPNLRYLVGRDAKMQLAFKRILPWKTYEKMIANFLKID
jgi:NAD(P)-dependent dehydrogenase (short-subunit alcohol dehydrogenase family)